jgi:hypothetical protein
LAAGHDIVCSLPATVVSGSHCTDEIETVEFVVPTVTTSARLVPPAGTE